MDLPFNADAEKQVLANMLFSKDILTESFTRLSEDDFYVNANKIIFAALKSIHDKVGVTVDTSSLIEELTVEGNLEKVGDAAYILELADAYNDTMNADYYIKSVEEKSVLRQIILASKDVVEKWQSDSAGDIDSYINKVAGKIDLITKKRRVENLVSINEAFNEYKERVKGIRRGDDDFKGLMTGYRTFDKLSLGFHPGEMTILAARPSVGKSALALNFIFNVALKTSKPCIFFSLEMDTAQVTNRILAAKSAVPLRKIQEASFTTEEEKSLNLAMKAISESNLYIDNTTSIKLVDIRAKLNKIQARFGSVGLVAIDYIGLITPDVKAKGDINRSVELGKISAGIKGIARDFHCPVLCLSQLNREGDNAGKENKAKRPGLTNLRESGSLEQDADVVMFIHREDYQEAEASANTQEGADDPNAESNSAVTLIIAKNRNGRLFDLDFMFQKHIGRFVEMDKTRE